jgi:hypothetical protein
MVAKTRLSARCVWFATPTRTGNEDEIEKKYLGDARLFWRLSSKIVDCTRGGFVIK